MRKTTFGVILGALFFAVVGIALAASQQNTMDYTSTVKYKGKATKKKPKNATYNGILTVRNQNGGQPNVSTNTEVFFAKQFKQNARKFKSCAKSAFDGKSSIPKRCNKATVGDGTASATVGQPGQQGQVAGLKVKVINGPKGKRVFLAVNGPGTGNLWRAIDGPVTKLKGKYGFKINFKVPKDLQQILGSQIALTDFDVKLKTKRKVKIKRKRASFLQITKCPASKQLPTKAVTHFQDNSGNAPGQVVVSEKTMACH